MSIAFRPLLVRSLLVCLFASLAHSSLQAQATTGNTTLDRHLSRVDLGISGIGVFTKDVSGTNYLGAKLDQNTSSTMGALVTLRYTAKPWLGFEFNYTYARYTQNFSQYITTGVQTNANEYTLGYVAHPPHQFLGMQPFFGGGVGSTAFRPTPGGGQSLMTQARMTYYYNVGVDKPIGEHFGVRGLFRQTFYKAPDFGQNYFTIQQQTHTIEPGAGFYLRF